MVEEGEIGVGDYIVSEGRGSGGQSGLKLGREGTD